MTNVLILQPDPFDPPALIGDCLARRGIEMRIRRSDLGARVGSDDGDADGLIILGGEQSVLDPGHAGMFTDMYGAVRRCHTQGRPVLGICLGAQVVARAFGAPVRALDELRFGFLPVRLRADAVPDPLLDGQEPEPRIFCWHEDCFDLPEGALHLAETAQVPAYGFRLGALTYGFQCHFEYSRDSLDTVLDVAGHVVPRHLGPRGVELIEDMPAQIVRHMAGAARFGTAIGDAWADLVLASSA